LTLKSSLGLTFILLLGSIGRERKMESESKREGVKAHLAIDSFISGFSDFLGTHLASDLKKSLRDRMLNALIGRSWREKSFLAKLSFTCKEDG